jgi:hypothetical protein
MVNELIRVALRYGNISTLRRIGKLLALEGVAKPYLRRLAQRLKPSSALIPWVPTLPKRGATDRQWGVVVNYEF